MSGTKYVDSEVGPPGYGAGMLPRRRVPAAAGVPKLPDLSEERGSAAGGRTAGHLRAGTAGRGEPGRTSRAGRGEGAAGGRAGRAVYGEQHSESTGMERALRWPCMKGSMGGAV